MREVFVAALLILAASAGPSLTDDGVPPRKLIAEEAIRLASNRLYTEILIRASLNGWHFAPDKLKNGYERHFQELRLQFIDRGYTVVPGTLQKPPSPSLTSSGQPAAE
jgi:hypothetical protein